MRKELKSTLLTLILTFSLFTIFASVPTFAPVAKISSALAESLYTSQDVDVLVKTKSNHYAGVEANILQLGGQVKSKFKYVNGIAASIPGDKITALMADDNIATIYKDDLRFPTMDPRAPGLDMETTTASEYLAEFETTYLTTDMITGVEPNNYWNPIRMGAEPVWYETNDLGQDSLVVIIDTGLWAGHFMFGGSSILGGIDLSPDVGTPYEGWSSPNNHWHGTHVAGIVASTGGIIVDETSLLVQSIEYHSGMTLPPYLPIPGTKIIWLLGMAPAADLYGIKVFPHTGAGVPESYVIGGMEHALEMHLSGDYDVDVISMSLGGPTMYDGRDLEDQLVDVITSHGITLVTSAGNEGPASMTGGSPGSANTAITVGAAATPVQTRVYWDYYYGLSWAGDVLFTSETPLIYAYSSRGPTSDGRLKPTLSATGMMVLSAMPDAVDPQGLGWASGTSMACPAVSGAVALLNTYAETFIPGATPEDYKQALVAGAEWLPGFNKYDQGAGFLNAYDALVSLVTDPSIGDLAKPLAPTAGFAEWIGNMEIGNRDYEADIIDLQPGHKQEFIFLVNEHTEFIELEMTNLDLGIDPVGFNSFEVYIQSAKRTGYWYFIETANVWDDATFYIDDYETIVTGDVTGIYIDPYTRLAPIEPGYVKIVIENDWTSYDSISCHIKISRPMGGHTEKPDVKMHGFIREYEWTGWIQIEVPENTITAELTLSWMRDWRAYPTSDLDLIIYWDEGYNVDGATWNSPERAILNDPTILYLYIEGYSIYEKAPTLFGFGEPYELTITFTTS
ncbi:MAG: S8 family serine peptidase [Candidatus Bathyarchaeota archaeon]|nr:MAG: S8 family serine peptidase [Candidatus Bathyarchaeota archaeon]